MGNKFKILAISGSTREKSSNLNLIKAIADLTSQVLEIIIFDGLTCLPHFNPDLDDENVSVRVTDFRKKIKAADGIIICTPEYAIGVPGTLKNAIDWTVSSMEFSRKPVALITASTSGKVAHKSLLGTLLIIEARITAQTQLVVSSIKTKVNADCKITDDETLHKVQNLIGSLIGTMNDEPQNYLPAPLL